MVRPLVLALGLLTAWTVTVPALAGPAFCGLTGQPYESHAYDVSDDGRTIVGYGRPPSGYQGFRWNRADGLTWLGDLPDGDFSSRAYAVSADGSVVAGEGSIPWYSTGS